MRDRAVALAGDLVSTWLVCCLAIVGGGCVSGDRQWDGGFPFDGPIPGRVRVGIPDPEVSSGFIELEPDGDIVLGTFGQGGSHAELAFECVGFGNAVYWMFTVENLATGGEIMTTPFARPQPLLCDEDDRCVRSPNYVMLGGLADPDQLDGLHVQVTASVENEAGLRDEDSQTGYLRRAK